LTTLGPNPQMVSRRSGTAAAFAWMICLAAVLVWVLQTPEAWLREQLKTLQYWSLETCVVLGLALCAVLARDLLRGLDRRDGLRMGLLTAIAVVLTLFVAPRTNRIYYDEQIYQGIGQNLSDVKQAQMCNNGTVEYGQLQCWSGQYNKQPYAYPHALSLAYRAFGVHEATAFRLNALVMAATVCLVYLLVFIVFEDRIAAFFAALLIALTPEQLIWSATAAVEPSASLACVAALVAAAHFVRSRRTAALAGAGVAAAYAVQFRPESLLIVPVVLLMVWQGARDEFTRPRLWWAGLLFFALTAVHIGHVFAVRHEGWGTSDARLSLGYVAANLRVNGRFYFADARFPFVFTLLAAFGLSARRTGAKAAPIVLYFLVFFGIDLLFYAGSYNYGADVRYSVLTYPPLAVLGGLGAARAVEWLARVAPGVPARRALTAGLAFQFLWYAPLVRATTEEAWAARADMRFARSLVADLPGNSYVLTHNPGMFHVWGINAGQMSLLAADPAYLNHLAARYAGGIYLHWNFWCNVQDPVQQQFCRNALATRPVETVREYRERDQRFALYRLLMSGADRGVEHRAIR
jgi:4-amino-4-deoxy-L-arabinose transferase-like glycosyltransferase